MAEKVKIVVDPDKMVLGDLEILEQAQEGTFKEFLDLLERVATVEGVESVRQLPIPYLRDCVQAVIDALAVDAGN